jgi:hypothetical protein
MSAIISQPAPPAEAVRQTRCNLCNARPGRACSRKGDHLARWLAACTAGAITRDGLREVIVRLVVVTKWCVVTEAAECSQDEPGECWATGDGQREVHDLRKCEHFLPCAGGAA